jgi:3-phosphoshikimate 1-carboxyvinyltransferase
MNLILKPARNGIKGELQVPGDKSISHRAVMFGAIAKGKTTIHNFLKGEDCLSTIRCFQSMGVSIKEEDNVITVEGNGWEGLEEPKEILDVGNSGTTTRLMLGILAGRPFHSVIIGDESIAKRPMKRVTDPLKLMGAKIDGREEGQFTPISIRGGDLESFDYTLPVASAQVKSCIILAGLQTEGKTIIREPLQTRDHTEKMIQQFGGNVTVDNRTIEIIGKQPLEGTDVFVPSDVSSAAFFMVAGAIVPNSKVTLTRVGLNPSRTGIIEVMERMGASLQVEKVSSTGEPYGTVTVETSELTGIEIGGELIPSLIDELPVIALLATQAKGKTIIKDAEELKVKETNRIDAIVKELKKLGASIEATDDGMIIEGSTKLFGGQVDSWGDHRIGMTLAIASLICETDVILEDSAAVNISYPTFFDDIKKLLSRINGQ